MSDERLIELLIERPVAGGRMLARHEGAVVFVAHAIPGERVRARLRPASRRTPEADVVEVIEPSPARRAPPSDPACGGLVYAHIQYEEQLRLKGEIVADAFRRLARQAITPPIVAGSPERGYRMRARLHVRDGRAGFFREGTHAICDAAATGQLLPDTVEAVQRWIAAAPGRADACDAVNVVENVSAAERILHVELAGRARPEDLGAAADAVPGVTGVSVQVGPRVVALGGARSVSDSAAELFGGDSPIDPAVRWTRRATSFFQGNRFLTGALVRRVLALAAGTRVVDLYSGVGLFAVALAAAGARVVAVEGEASSGADLVANAKPFGEGLLVERADVEDVVRVQLTPPPDVVVLDPPRTGVARAALSGIAAWRAERLVYVSCDPPTLARDAALLAEAGYTLQALEGFDLFPNTAHVETIAVFVRA